MRATELAKKTIAGMIDSALLEADVTPDKVKALCKVAAKYGFYAVDVNSCYVRLAKRLLLQMKSPVKVLSTISFPLGQESTEAKVAEARQAFADGADEIDVMLNVGMLKVKDHRYVANEIHKVIEVAKRFGQDKFVKVILETGLLNQNEIVQACRIVKSVGADFVKTGTGYVKKATVQDVTLIRKVVGQDFGVKASGGIKTPEQAFALIKAGANRIGSSHAKEIIDAIH